MYNFLADYIKQSDMIIDIGAEQGDFTLFCWQTNSNANIYCFEPIQGNIEKNLNNVENATIIKNLIGNEHITKKIKTTSYVLSHLVKHEQEIPMVTLDSLHLTLCDFVKIPKDEHLVIIGAQETIQKFRPVIYVVDKTCESEDIIQQFGYEIKYVGLNSYIAKPLPLVEPQEIQSLI